jgi:hypothetical protein
LPHEPDWPRYMDEIRTFLAPPAPA